MPNTNRRRGFDFEREIVNYLRDCGYEAERMWGSDGRSRGLHQEVDVAWQLDGKEVHMQLKRKKVLPKYLKSGAVDMTVFREDRGDTLVLIPIDKLIDLLQKNDE